MGNKDADGLSTEGIIGIALGAGALVGILVVVCCVVKSRSRRKKKKFQHTFRGTIRDDRFATLSFRKRVSAPKETSCRVQLPSQAKEPRYVSMYHTNGVPLVNIIPNSTENSMKHHNNVSIGNKDIWKLYDSNVDDSMKQIHLKPPDLVKYSTGNQSPNILRVNRPPIPLPRSQYAQLRVPTRGCNLYRPESDCLSVISCDLGDPRNDTAVKRHSNLYIPTKPHRMRTDTADSARSSGIGMDLGAELPKG